MVGASFNAVTTKLDTQGRWTVAPAVGFAPEDSPLVIRIDSSPCVSSRILVGEWGRATERLPIGAVTGHRNG